MFPMVVLKNDFECVLGGMSQKTEPVSEIAEVLSAAPVSEILMGAKFVGGWRTLLVAVLSL